MQAIQHMTSDDDSENSLKTSIESDVNLTPRLDLGILTSTYLKTVSTKSW